MASTKNKEDAGSANRTVEPSQKADLPVCGLIMPISATGNHDEKHWAAVQTLLHRAIKSAGMEPANVWEGVNDRISKRTVSNTFRQDIVVADISDLNPNVMLELGLRLASKKPTVIVFEKGGKIPFDIADVGALPYPGDLNILGMEAFFEEFSNLLTSRLSAFAEGTYEPYLGDVVVEVLEPQTKEISVGEAVLERLEEISIRMSRLEKMNSANRPLMQRDRIRPAKSLVTINFAVPNSAQSSAEALIHKYSDYYTENNRGDITTFDVRFDGDTSAAKLDLMISEIKDLGGVIGNISYA